MPLTTLASRLHWAVSDFYWKDADNGAPAVSQKVLNTHAVKLMSMAEWRQNEAVLENIKLKVEKTDVPWEQTCYSEANLRSQGFCKLNGPTICAVDDGQGRAFIIFVYTPDQDGTSLLTLGNYAFGPKGKVLHKNTAGQSDVSKRGGKRQCGKMLMYGSKMNFGQNTPPGMNTQHHPLVYLPNGKPDACLNTYVKDLANAMTKMEKALTPAAAKARRKLARLYDPNKRHRISDSCYGFSLSLADTYVVSPHDDSGVSNEFIQFANRNGPLPPGHEWNFVVGGCILPLPHVAGQAVNITLPGSGVHHGTLPTSSTLPTFQHGNLGSALVTKKQFVDACREQTARGETTPSKYTASALYGVTAATQPLVTETKTTGSNVVANGAISTVGGKIKRKQVDLSVLSSPALGPTGVSPKYFDYSMFQGTKAEEQEESVQRKKTQRTAQPNLICDTPGIVAFSPVLDLMDRDFFGDLLADPMITSPPLNGDHMHELSGCFSGY